jgi:hypothetical protein
LSLQRLASKTGKKKLHQQHDDEKKVLRGGEGPVQATGNLKGMNVIGGRF